MQGSEKIIYWAECQRGCKWWSWNVNPDCLAQSRAQSPWGHLLPYAQWGWRWVYFFHTGENCSLSSAPVTLTLYSLLCLWLLVECDKLGWVDSALWCSGEWVVRCFDSQKKRLCCQMVLKWTRSPAKLSSHPHGFEEDYDRQPWSDTCQLPHIAVPGLQVGSLWYLFPFKSVDGLVPWFHWAPPVLQGGWEMHAHALSLPAASIVLPIPPLPAPLIPILTIFH